MATTQEIRTLMSQPTRFDLMRQELKTPGVLAEHEKQREEVETESLTLENSELKKNLDIVIEENGTLKTQIEELTEKEPEEGAIKNLLNKFINNGGK